MSNVTKESVWMTSGPRSIAGLRQVADALAGVGVPAEAELTVTTGGEWLNVEARWLYDDDQDEVLELEPSAPVGASS